MKRLLALLLVLILPAQAAAITGFPTTAAETITVSNVSIGFTTNLCREPQGPGERGALIQVKGNDVYFELNGTTASATSYQASAGTFMELVRPSQFRAIRVTADATIKITCFGGQ